MDISQPPKRLLAIDVAKGFGILMVIWYHMHYTLVNELNLFFMPLFFLMSGFFFRPDVSFKTFCQKRFQGLIGPLIIFCALSLLLEWGIYDMEDWQIDRGYFTFWQIGNVPLWFILSLTMTMLMAWIVERLRRPWIGYLLLLIVAFILGYSGYRTPLFSKSALMALPFFALGIYGKDRILNAPRKVVLPVSVFAIVSAFWFLHSSDPILNFHCDDFPRYFVNWFVPSLGVCLVVIWSARFLARKGPDTWLVRALAMLGESSLLIMCVHYWFVPPIYDSLCDIFLQFTIFEHGRLRQLAALLTSIPIAFLSLYVGKIIRFIFPFFFGRKYRRPSLPSFIMPSGN